MRLLLDTHVAIWADSDTARLPGAIRELISAPENEVSVSVVSLWEIAIKRAQRRRNAPPTSAATAEANFRQLGMIILPVSAAHALAVEALPVLHNDPFDRLLVAQALSEPMRLVTHDEKLGAYSDTIITF